MSPPVALRENRLQGLCVIPLAVSLGRKRRRRHPGAQFARVVRAAPWPMLGGVVSRHRRAGAFLLLAWAAVVLEARRPRPASAETIWLPSPITPPSAPERLAPDERVFRLRVDEPVPDGIRRIALGQIDDILDRLEGRSGEDVGTAIHESRKSLKRLRTVVRLVAA